MIHLKKKEFESALKIPVASNGHKVLYAFIKKQDFAKFIGIAENLLSEYQNKKPIGHKNMNRILIGIEAITKEKPMPEDFFRLEN